MNLGGYVVVELLLTEFTILKATSYVCTPVAVELLRHKTSLFPVHKEANASGFSYAMQASLTFIHVQHFCQKIISKTNHALV